MGELYVKGEKLPTSQEVTQTTVVTQEEIEATHSQNVADALSHVPGITVSMGVKNQPSISLQGLNQTETLVLIDGVPYYETNFGLLNLTTIPVEMIDKIVVEKGVSSVLYGPNSLGGVINIITRKPTDRPSLDAQGRVRGLPVIRLVHIPRHEGGHAQLLVRLRSSGFEGVLSVQ